MPEFKVWFEETQVWSIVVEAADEDAAEDAVTLMYENDDLAAANREDRRLEILSPETAAI